MSLFVLSGCATKMKKHEAEDHWLKVAKYFEWSCLNEYNSKENKSRRFKSRDYVTTCDYAYNRGNWGKGWAFHEEYMAGFVKFLEKRYKPLVKVKGASRLGFEHLIFYLMQDGASHLTVEIREKWGYDENTPVRKPDSDYLYLAMKLYSKGKDPTKENFFGGAQYPPDEEKKSADSLIKLKQKKFAKGAAAMRRKKNVRESRIRNINAGKRAAYQDTMGYLISKKQEYSRPSSSSSSGNSYNSNNSNYGGNVNYLYKPTTFEKPKSSTSSNNQGKMSSCSPADRKPGSGKFCIIEQSGSKESACELAKAHRRSPTGVKLCSKNGANKLPQIVKNWSAGSCNCGSVGNGAGVFCKVFYTYSCENQNPGSGTGKTISK